MTKVIGLLAAVVAGVAHAQARPPTNDPAGAAVDVNKVYFEFQVDRPVRQAPNPIQPEYPEALKKLGTDAEVRAQFVVDTLGFADLASFKIVKSPHELFSMSVLAVVANSRYLPAEVRGRKVKQVVTQRFAFAVPK